MRFAIFSDIHANLQAWEAVLADIQSQGADTLVCLGDVVGYGPMPEPVLESVYQYTDNFVLGNHDAVVGGRIDAATFNGHAQYVIRWTAQQLGDEGAAFFAQVPLTLRGEKMLFTHGDAARPGHFDYVVKAEDARPSFQACRDEVIFFGHTHDPCVFACANNKGIIDKLPGTDLVLKRGRRYMINPGSVGDPRTASDLRGSYCLYDDTTRRLSFRRVAFDTEAYRADLEASGLEMKPYFLRVIDAGSRRPEEDEELAVVQDHREEVEVDESLLVQPRALVTVGSPMANRPKLHFGYAHPQSHGYPGTAPVPPPGYQVTQPIQQAPKTRNGLAVLIVGVLIGVIGVIYVMNRMSDPSRVPAPKPKKDRESLTPEEEGWEEAEEAEEVRGATPAEVEKVPKLADPVFSLAANPATQLSELGATLPDGVKLVDSDFGGTAIKFGAGAAPVEIDRLQALDFAGSISVSAWIRLKPSSSERLVFARKVGDQLPIFLKVIPKDKKYKGSVVFGIEGVQPAMVRTSSRTRVDDGEWHFVMGMYDEKKRDLRIYLDGYRASGKPATVKSTGKRRLQKGPVVIGGGDFNGEISGLRIYDHGLHTAQMEAVYEAEK